MRDARILYLDVNGHHALGLGWITDCMHGWEMEKDLFMLLLLWIINIDELRKQMCPCVPCVYSYRVSYPILS